MKKFFMLVLILAAFPAISQTYIKFNAPTTLLGIPQIGIETSLAKKVTFQGDVLGAYWESVNNAPFKTLMVFSEVRYHFNENDKGLYVGGHVGGAIFELQKWNYLNTDKYQKGEAFFLGITIGYQVKINDKWMIDMFIGGGNQQAHYKGRYLSNNEPYEFAKYNKSGEWLPYRGGIMFCYKL
ncbi:DUF3575 domain-containing protein [Flavobacterium sp. NRK1]|uniref:DUF3575 domain-containing protein n=1 Tax=Flavobacterium sp. NRK1 TaxID=2954929 RepID=UPI0020931E32|nr:DUF3575 domain-containing protein [Flavobacterium sp. NRK1]MCO6149483.1 DUF3575 domain-containing protein [Flavobacterium sp. NRK1]